KRCSAKTVRSCARSALIECSIGKAKESKKAIMRIFRRNHARRRREAAGEGRNARARWTAARKDGGTGRRRAKPRKPARDRGSLPRRRPAAGLPSRRNVWLRCLRPALAWKNG